MTDKKGRRLVYLGKPSKPPEELTKEDVDAWAQEVAAAIKKATQPLDNEPPRT